MYFVLFPKDEIPIQLSIMHVVNVQEGYNCSKVHIFWEGHKILRNLHQLLVLCSASQIIDVEISQKFVAFSDIWTLCNHICNNFTWSRLYFYSINQVSNAKVWVKLNHCASRKNMVSLINSFSMNIDILLEQPQENNNMHTIFFILVIRYSL